MLGSWASKTKPDCRTSYAASGVGVIKAVAASPGITRGTGFFLGGN